MDATIAICTWNRAELLEQTLAHMRQLKVPAGATWEIVVVNNRSTDQTDQVLARHAQWLPLRRVFEPQQGQSHARNAAARAARGELILWTDDDVLVGPRWLAALLAEAQQQPAVAFFGGPIEPWFETPPPEWLARNWRQFASAYAVRDLGPEPIQCDASRLPFGANFAVRRAVQTQFLYDGRLGRVAHSEVRGEESELLLRLLADGQRGQWVPAAKVRHFIPRQRLTQRYLQGFYRGVGQAEVIRQTPRPAGKLSSLRRRAWLSLSSAASAHWFAVLQAAGGHGGKPWAKALIRSSVQQGRLAS
ncbi:MAG: glycosyltransferase [Pirellulaceae bacterium]